MTSPREQPDHDAEHPAARTLAGSLDAEDFKSLFRGHPGGVAVITADDGSGPVALTATSVSSISTEPPLLIFSLSTTSSATPVLSQVDSLVVHLLDADDLGLARLASTSGIDRFADQSLWTRLVTGEPVFHSARAWVRAAVISRIEAGASVVVVAHALQSHIERDAGHSPALVYLNRTWHRLDDDTVVG